MNRKILVTGGAGYIGSHCCKLLAENGYKPIVYDNLSTGDRSFVKWGPLIEGDIRDRERIERVIASESPAAVMHFAALLSVEESVSAPERYWSVNVGGTQSLLDAMRANSCDKLVFSSTCAVYGQPERLPINEETPKDPINPYGACKLAAEWMMEHYDRAHGLRSVRLRYFNACGADPGGEVGYHSAGPQLLPLVLEVASGRRPNISVYGVDYPTPDGTAVRDYIHVTDLATAHLAALEHLTKEGETLVVNLGTGHGVSVAEIIATAERVIGCEIPRVMAPRRKGDPAKLVADPTRAATTLGWRAERSNLGVVIGDAWRWHQARFGASIGPSGLERAAKNR